MYPYIRQDDPFHRHFQLLSIIGLLAPPSWICMQSFCWWRMAGQLYTIHQGATKWHVG